MPLPGVEVRLRPLPGAGPGAGEILVKTSRGVIVGGGGAPRLDADMSRTRP